MWTSSKTKWQQKMLMKTSEETVWIEFVCFQSDRAAEEHMLQTAAPWLQGFSLSKLFLSYTECADTEQVFNTSLPHQLHIWTSLPCVRVRYSFWECTICINIYIIHLKLTKLFHFPFGLFSIVTHFIITLVRYFHIYYPFLVCLIIPWQPPSVEATVLLPLNYFPFKINNLDFFFF